MSSISITKDLFKRNNMSIQVGYMTQKIKVEVPEPLEMPKILKKVILIFVM
jgi:hypothetical protein